MHLERAGHEIRLHTPRAQKLAALDPFNLDVTPTDGDENGRNVERLVVLDRVGERSVAFRAPVGILHNPPEHDISRDRTTRVVRNVVEKTVVGFGLAFRTRLGFRHRDDAEWERRSKGTVRRGRRRWKGACGGRKGGGLRPCR